MNEHFLYTNYILKQAIKSFYHVNIIVFNKIIYMIFQVNI